MSFFLFSLSVMICHYHEECIVKRSMSSFAYVYDHDTDRMDTQTRTDAQVLSAACLFVSWDWTTITMTRMTRAWVWVRCEVKVNQTHVVQLLVGYICITTKRLVDSNDDLQAFSLFTFTISLSNSPTRNENFALASTWVFDLLRSPLVPYHASCFITIHYSFIQHY